MAADELSTPLGKTTRQKRTFRLPFSAMQAVASVLGLFLLGFLGFALFGDNPFGGEPVARVALKAPTAGDTPAPAAAAKAPVQVIAAKPPAPAGQRTITIIDGSSGARQDVVVSGDGTEKSDPAAATSVMANINPALLEKTRYGMIPVTAEGIKPITAYAAASDAERAKVARVPTIAIVVGGLGVGAAKTTDAIMKLPGPVTLAFTPYGSDPGKLVERARAQRHEVLLQIPMEPFDYPDNDPGPQTLLAGTAADQNLDRLHWHLSRFQGYVGLANFMGGRFVTSDAAMQPIIREAASRGLGYLDDGSSPRSLAGSLAAGQSMPFARADLIIDTVPSAAEIDKALARLEVVAKERGSAVGFASALPISIEHLGNWIKTLESRGISLVPLTTVMLKPKSG